LQITSPNGVARREPQGWLTLVGARLHNLKRIDVRFPLGVMTCITGVSGSGKSSLVVQTLQPALARALHGAHAVPGVHDRIEGLEQIDKVIHIDQRNMLKKVVVKGARPISTQVTKRRMFHDI
jgi:excinuclease ABC subunit A